MTLEERARSVRTPDDLATLVSELRADFGANPAGWENADLGSFFDAMAAWVRDVDGYDQNAGQALSALSPWRVMADLLVAARIYE
jgi:hypothetical protein